MTNKTIADIVAEKRHRADEIERDVSAKMASGKMVSDQYARELIADLRREADRIETAWERERQPLTIAEWIDKTETVADIAAVLRRYVLPSLAERLEAAWKREKADAESDALAVGGIVEAARTTEKSSAVGNAAAMREAMQKVEESAAEIMERVRHKDGLAFNTANYIAGIAKDALSAPPRQCDVGTPYEQANRMRQFCAKQKRDGIINCGYCPIKHQYQRDCTLAWAQMPYAEEGDQL